jgi:hypothetical protein
MEARMSRPRHAPDLTDLREALLGIAAVAWVLGLFVAVEAAAGTLLH